jgi:hypothetical protein
MGDRWRQWKSRLRVKYIYYNEFNITPQQWAVFCQQWAVVCQQCETEEFKVNFKPKP